MDVARLLRVKTEGFPQFSGKILRRVDARLLLVGMSVMAPLEEFTPWFSESRASTEYFSRRIN